MEHGAFGAMLKTNARRIIAAAALATLIVAPTSALAAVEWTVPTEMMTNHTEDGTEIYVTASAHRAAEPSVDILGVSNTTINAASGFSVSSEGTAEEQLAQAVTVVNFGIWGSSANENPNSYFWNKFYTYYANTQEGLEQPDKWETLVITTETVGPMGYDGNSGVLGSDATSYDLYGTDVTLSLRPDIVVGIGDGTEMAEAVAAVNSIDPSSDVYREGDETYDPIGVTYDSTNLSTMITTMYDIANAAQTVIDESDGATQARYGDPVDIAAEYEAFIRATQYYVLYCLDADGVDQKKVAFVSGFTEDGLITLADSNNPSVSTTSTNRVVESVENVVDNVMYTLQEEGKASTVTIESQGRGGETQTSEVVAVTPEDLAASGVEVIIFSTASAGSDETSGNDLLESWTSAVAGYDELSALPVLTTLPSACYGVTMNSVDNAQNVGTVMGFVYPEYVNTVDLLTYYYRNLYHITDEAQLPTVVNRTIVDSNASLRTDMGVEATTANYDEEAILEDWATGMLYYLDNQETVEAINPEGLTASETLLAWFGLTE